MALTKLKWHSIVATTQWEDYGRKQSEAHSALQELLGVRSRPGNADDAKLLKDDAHVRRRPHAGGRE